MSNNITLPKEYIQIPNLEVCSNKLINAEGLFEVNGFSPLLIGKGDIPIIWLYTRVHNNQWISVIENNISLNRQVTINNRNSERRIILKIKSLEILNARMKNGNTCIVEKLDLRPVGLKVFGNKQGLTIGNFKFSQNTYYGSKYMIGLNN